MFTRRQVVKGIGVSTLAIAAGPLFARSAFAQDTVDVEQLMMPPAMGDETLGDPNAPVTIVEYASLNCPHCARVQQTVFPDFKAQYVDTGKVYYVYRDFPLNPLATAASMLARSAPNGNFFQVIDLLFAMQNVWSPATAAPDFNPVDALFGILKQAGYTEETFQSALSDQTLLDGINAEAQRGADVFGVSGTPTFFINGMRKVGEVTFEELQGLLDPLLA